ncbi:MAG: chorismate synthase [Desulfobulbaceae bacterium]|jgi:chorismate synthase|nr:chorismate synthase [Desulfobulbaceae bacterium]HKJ15022.1 chorismate synthase [Desulfobulbales bacterium]MDH3542249.1 chorismate synthase [Desulfobulbaceae bacterium]MDH3782594.1 chorismate synthase [Desulfobulbaceae bacterium]MDH3866992.1 chorismate synthase [Desulfobulbaceae bacterium]
MAGNTFGKIFRVTTWGESHGSALGAVIDGCPPGLELDVTDIQNDLDKRRPGKGGGESPRREPDQVEILSGVFEGLTTGTPISLIIYNKDAQSKAYDHLQDIFRPGHGDLTYLKKYGIRDHRGGGRASARETAARVAAGAVARKVLAENDISVIAYTVALGDVSTSRRNLKDITKNRLYCPDMATAVLMEEFINTVRKKGDSLGGVVEIMAAGCPVGLGEPVFDKLDAVLAQALMSIGAVKGVEIGAGFRAAELLGSENNDAITPKGYRTNNAGGILAGISNGDPIIVRAAVKPIPSISLEQDTMNLDNEPVKIKVGGRHDISAIPRIVPVCEAMVCLALADHLLRQKAIEN